MTTATTKVFFECYDVQEMKEYCKTHGIALPKFYGYADSLKYDYFTTDFQTWQQLFINLPYSVAGCYTC